MGHGIPGDDRKIWNSGIVRRVLRIRWRAVTHSAEITSNGNRIIYRRDRTPHISLHRSLGRVLESTASHCHGIFECRWCSHLGVSTRNSKHSSATDNRGRRTVWSGFQTMVLPYSTCVSIFCILI